MVIYLVKNGNSTIYSFKERIFAEMMVKAFKQYYNEDCYEVEHVEVIDWIYKLEDMMEYIKLQFEVPDKD